MGQKIYLFILLTNNHKFHISILIVMPKYWGKQIFTHGRFPEVGQKQKTEEKKKEREKEERKLVKTMAKLRMAHASTHGARKPPGPKERKSMITMVGTCRLNKLFCCGLISSVIKVNLTTGDYSTLPSANFLFIFLIVTPVLVFQFHRVTAIVVITFSLE